MCGRYQFSAAESDDLRQIVRSIQKRCGQDELNFRIIDGDVAPSCSAPVLISRGDKVVGDLQKLYGENGYPQAVLVAKKAFIAENTEFIGQFTQAMEANSAWLLDEKTQAQTIYDAVVGHYLKEGTTPTFSVTDLTREVIGACAVRFDSAADCKTRVNEFLAELSAAAGQTFAASDAFFYLPA